MPVILGIESTAHTFGVGIVNMGKILANVKKSYTTDSGGIIPIEAAKHHKKNKFDIYSEAVRIAGIKENKIDAIAFSQGPGLAPCLLEGIKFAKELAKKLRKPLIPVNHCIAHLEIGASLEQGPENPVMLYVSGANTQIIAYSAGKYRIFGETLDIGVGNFIDIFARLLKLGFPGGAKIEALAKKGKKYIELPYKVKGMDVALSGILTNLKQNLEKIKSNPSFHHSNTLLLDNNYNKKRTSTLKFTESARVSESERGNYTLADLAYSMQETVFAMLVETAERALAHTEKKELLLGGGVACNSRLQEMCKIMCEERGAKLFVPSNELLQDNGSMVAYTGEILFNNGEYVKPENVDKVDITPRQRTDQVKIKYK